MNSNVKNIYKNTIIGLVLKVLLLIVSFANRTIFIKLLGSEYLGIAGLYSNIISLLSLADLGIYTAFMFSLYKPLSAKDEIQIGALIKYFSKIYKIIGFVVILIGLCIVPFLQYLVNSNNLDETEFKMYFILFVLNSGLSYFNVCESTLLRADKKVYIVDLVTSLITILAYVLQVVFLLITNDYYSYIIVQIFMTILTNLILKLITIKKYPYLKKKNQKENIKIDNDVKRGIFNNIKSVLVYKIGCVVMNSTDNILISILLGTVVVGYYSNYSLITVTITTFITILINSILPNIGEINTRGDSEKTLKAFNIINYFFYIIGAYITSTLVCVFNDFIKIWIQDEQYVLSNFDVLMICFNFYVTCITNPIWMFRESTGLFKDVRYLLIFAAVLNIILSFVFCKYLGLAGIILATAVSRIVTTLLYEPIILYKKIFNLKSAFYWKKSILYIIIGVVVCISCYFICNLFTVSIINFIIKCFICIFITIIITILFSFKTDEFQYLLKIVKLWRK